MAKAEGIPPTASVASVGLGLRYVGSGEYQHCYAFSGGFAQSTDAVSMLKFTTGAGYILGTLTCCGAVEFNTPQTGGVTGFQLTLNGDVVWLADTDTTEEDQPGSVSIDILFPPFTEIELKVDAGEGANPNEYSTAVFTGRVYGAA